MVRICVIAAILFLNSIIQSTIFAFVQVRGVKPDSLAVIVISFALLSGNPLGAVVGFFGGLMQDILYGQAIGFYALQYMLVGYLTGMLHKKFFLGSVILPVLLVVLTTVFRGTIILVYMFFTRFVVPIQYAFVNVLLPEAMYTALITLPIYFGVSRLYGYKFMNKRWLFRK